MSLFQYVIIIAALGLIGRALARCVKKQISIWLFLLWTASWTGVAIIAIYPVIINRLADLVGIGRGVDLMIYVALGAIIYLLFRQQIKISRIEKDIATIVQTDAINDVLSRPAADSAQKK